MIETHCWIRIRGRADCENRIKELKYDFAADSFNMKDFWAAEATLKTLMLAYSLMSPMHQVLLKTSGRNTDIDQSKQCRKSSTGAASERFSDADFS